jgi:hypothetical protein
MIYWKWTNLNGFEIIRFIQINKLQGGIENGTRKADKAGKPKR